MEAIDDRRLLHPTPLVTGVNLGGLFKNQWHSGDEGWGYEDLVPYFEKAEVPKVVTRLVGNSHVSIPLTMHLDA
ncbi:hypothetical protein PHLCEN_2v3155 [Hermanssonia centrifuga]|uniref:Uncharacterized protein n=1 Tax=Hermanssonia centrifuga TaxID=98765 RepID=A0A2R6R113_9APHY|nr:hypothetical protein PHLCEN_2v3155 [Hermanssonia centrifuga]